jgi:hypothetical protein
MCKLMNRKVLFSVICRGYRHQNDHYYVFFVMSFDIAEELLMRHFERHGYKKPQLTLPERQLGPQKSA